MTNDSPVYDAVHRHGKAIVTMDIGQIMNDLMPDAMMKLQQAAGGGTALQINDYEVLGHTQDGNDFLYEVKYIGPQSFTVRARWSQIGAEWKIVDADIIAREGELDRLADEAIAENRSGETQSLDPDAR